MRYVNCICHLLYWDEAFEHGSSYSHVRQGGEYVVRNFVGAIEDISVPASTVVTDLFSRGAWEYYGKKNLVWDDSEEECETVSRARWGTRGLSIRNARVNSESH
jgi:hypothetical protein